MRRLVCSLAIVSGLGGEGLAQYASCPGGVCSVPETSSTVRASVRSRSGPSGGGLLGGLGRALLGSRRGGGASAYGSAYGAAYGSYGAPQAFSGTYAAPQLFAQAQTFEGGSCYSSGGAAPMSYSPYSPYSVPPMYSAPPMYNAPPPVFYSTPQSDVDDQGWAPVSYRVIRAQPVRRRMARAPSRPERRPTAVAVRPARTDPPVEQVAERAP